MQLHLDIWTRQGEGHSALVPAGLWVRYEPLGRWFSDRVKGIKAAADRQLAGEHAAIPKVVSTRPAPPTKGARTRGVFRMDTGWEGEVSSRNLPSDPRGRRKCVREFDAMGKVTVVGSYIVALVMDVDRIPLEGETVVGRNYHTTHGGKGSNVAACAARLGADTTFLGKIGRDPFGEGFLSLLEREGVRRDAVLYSDQRPTAVGFIIFSTRGTNLIVIDKGANGDFLPADVKTNAGVIQGADVSLSPLEIPLETALAAAKVAQSAGRKFILNPAPAEDLRGSDLSGVFALTPNEREGRVCLGLAPDAPVSDHDVAKRLLELGPRHVMLTRGEKGALWASQDGLHTVPALPVKVVDTVGAGDAFNAGLAVGLSEGKPVLEAIALGVTAASLSTQRRETIESYSRRNEVEEHAVKVLQAARAFRTEEP